MLNGLSLFTGIGGIDVALSDYVRPVAYCEIDPYCQGVLLSRMADGLLPNSPIWDDVKTLQGADFRGSPDIIYGGFPCQDISIAGNGKGLAGERSGLFFEIVRLAKEIKPPFIFLENVPAITTRGGLQVVREITEMGYDCRWCVISASSVGALHRRERWFLLAHSKHHGTSSSSTGRSVRECTSSGKKSEQQAESIGETERASSLSRNVADSDCQGCNQEQGRISIGLQKTYSESSNSNFENGSNTDCKPSEQTNTNPELITTRTNAWRESSRQYWPFKSREHWQEVVCGVCRTSDGVQFHVDRLRALGNAVVPQQCKKAFEILMGLKT